MDFIIIIASLIITSFTLYFLFSKRPEHVIKAAPGFLVSLGIAFTFLGICLGLQNFNSDNISSSLPQLIINIKMAFWGSFFGVTGAVIIKGKALISKRYDDVGQTIEDIIISQDKSKELTELTNKHLIDLTKLIKLLADRVRQESQRGNSQIAEVRSILERLTDHIESFTSGSEGNPWLTESRAMHLETIAKLEAMKGAIDTFFDQHMRQSTVAFTTAIKGSIKLLNEDLSAQLGANFKQFNQGLGAMLLWQESYKGQINNWLELESEQEQHISRIVSLLEKTSQEIGTTSSALTTMNNTNKEIHMLSEKASVTLSAIASVENVMKKDIEASSSALKVMADEMISTSMLLKDHAEKIKSIPSEHQAALFELADNQLKEISSRNEKLCHVIDVSFKKIADTVDYEYLAKINQLAEKQLNQLLDASRQLGTSYQEHLSTQERYFADISAGFLRSAEGSLSQVDARLKKILESISTSQQGLDAGTKKQLEDSLNTLGNNLLRISNKYTEDYQSVLEGFTRAMVQGSKK